MESLDERRNEDVPRLEARTSFFTRKLALKLSQRGAAVPPSVATFLDTPIQVFNENHRVYFEEKFCPLIPSIISMLMEVFNEMGADKEGWEDMITYNSKTDTPIKICARAVLVRKEKEIQDSDILVVGKEQRTKKIQLPPQFHQLNATPC